MHFDFKSLVNLECLFRTTTVYLTIPLASYIVRLSLYFSRIKQRNWDLKTVSLNQLNQIVLFICLYDALWKRAASLPSGTFCWLT